MGMKSMIGKRIAVEREIKNISQVELAKIAGVTSNTLSLIENGDVYPRLDTLKKICNALDVLVCEIIEGY